MKNRLNCEGIANLYTMEQEEDRTGELLDIASRSEWRKAVKTDLESSKFRGRENVPDRKQFRVQ